MSHWYFAILTILNVPIIFTIHDRFHQASYASLLQLVWDFIIYACSIFSARPLSILPYPFSTASLTFSLFSFDSSSRSTFRPRAPTLYLCSSLTNVLLVCGLFLSRLSSLHSSLFIFTLSLVSSTSFISLFLALSSSTPPLNNTHQPASRYYNSTPAAPTVWHTTLLIFFPRFHRFQPEFSTTLCKRRPPARLYALPPTPQNARIHPFDRR